MVIHQAIKAIPHPHQPAVLLWPDVPLDSEEEDENHIHQVNLVEILIKDSPASNKLGISLSSHSDTKEPEKKYTFYPTLESHHRKAILLSHIKTLVISSTFSKALCQDINLWSKRIGASPGLTPTKTLLPKFEKLTISGEMVTQMMDYQDRHLGQPHPILDFLKTVGKPKHLCINLPVLTIDDRQNYISSRILLDRIYLDGITWKEKIYQVSTRFRSFANTRKYEELRHILKCFNTSDIGTLTIHNFGNGDLLTSFTNTRIFTHKCQCYDKQTPELGCFDHVTQATRMKQLTKLAAAITPLKPGNSEPRRVAIIAGNFSHTKVGWFRILKSKIPKLEAEKFRLSGLQEAEPCQCCGTKEGVKGDSGLA
ncbi:hypothetical protein I302_105806 [Kwoniella bestiolae CBS 10118]|uniref:Uncharacterized protein n=1 Tax=Kwoniella bestiolae CBS 10118 TaxID=1296100 RepID=A0A1B9G267_9TREE|nr:hypothetical protein I302_04927 [Kwoniella bestiolae CBS 10118]OCF25117.1 hypothetical protein I302_04927 [Kwoniella bestiolae CBS 10118]